MKNNKTYSRLFLAALSLVLALGLSSSAFGAATIVINNTNAAGIGFNDTTVVAPVGGNAGTTLGQQRLIAFTHAANIWGATLTSFVTIVINAQFTALSCTATSATLGSAGATSIYANFPGAPVAGHWYSQALANKLNGADLDPGQADINANFNVNLGNTGCLTGTPFYWGLDGNHGTAVDFVAVLLHEMGHGVGFQTFTSGSTGAYISGGLPSIWDKFLFDVTANKAWDAMATNAERVASAKNTNNLVWTGASVATYVPGILSGTPTLKINTPAGIAGNYAVGTAAFGNPLSAGGTTADLVLAVDGTPPVNDGCEALTNGAALAGKIAVIDRGVCGFIVKVKNAQNAGAVGAIIVNNVAGPAAGMAGVDATITIPSVMVSQADGNTIKAQLPGVNGTLKLDNANKAGADLSGRARMFAPNPFQSGSSVSHFDTSGFPNQLMEPSINADLTHSVAPPQDLTVPLLNDIGWGVALPPPPAPGFIYNALSNPASTKYTLKVNGPNYEIRDSLSNALLATQSVAITTSITINGQNGVSDTLTVDFSGGGIGSIVVYDGGTGGTDTLKTQGGNFGNGTSTPSGPHSGLMLYSGGATGSAVIQYTGLEPILDTNVAASFIINGTVNADVINYTVGGVVANGLVSSSSFESIEFSNKGTLIINGLEGTDTITLTNPNTPTGLTGITVNADAGTDSVTGLGINGQLDNLRFLPSAAGAGQVVNDNAPQVDVTLTGTEQLNLILNSADGDGVRVDGTTGNDAITLTIGAVPGSGSFTGTMNGGAFSMIPTSFTGAASASNDHDVNFFNPGGSDSFVYNGNNANEVINLQTGEAGGLDVRDTIANVVWIRAEVFNVTSIQVNALDGVDDVTVSPFPNGPAKALFINGGNPTTYGDTISVNTAGVSNPLLNLDLNGNGTFTSTTHQTINLTGFEPRPTSVVVGSLQNPAVYGQSVSFTATVSSIFPGPAIGGTVQFVVDGTNFGAPVAVSGGFAQSTAANSLTVAGSPHSVIAQYSGDGNYGSGNGTLAGGQLINKALSNTALTSAPNASVFGQQVTFTATVTAQAPGSGTPTGQVNFIEGLNQIGTGTLNGAGVATFATSSLVAGTHSVSAVFVGDANFIGSTSNLVSQVVNKVNATCTVTPYNVTYDAALHTATGQCTGIGGAGDVLAGLNLAGTAHIIAGSYPTDPWTFTDVTGNYNNASGTVADNIDKRVLTVTVQNRTRVFGSANPIFAAILTGLLSGDTPAAGEPSLTTTATQFSPVGSYPIAAALGTLVSANYSFNFVPGTLEITQAATTTTITNAASLSSASTTIGQSYAVNWTIAPVAPSTGTPTGTVTVTDGAGANCSAAVAAGTCNLTPTSAGPKTITANYPGDTNFTGSASQVVQHAVVIAITGNIKQYGSNANLAGVTVTLSGSFPGSAVTDANGNYTLGLPATCATCVITPSGLGKTYEAITRTYTNVTANIANADFLAYNDLGPGANPRNVRAENSVTIAGNPVVVPVVVTSQGNETKVAFSLNYSVAALGVPTVACGDDVPGCTVVVNNLQPGKEGITITPAATLTAGTREIANVTFPTFANTLGSTPVSFGDIPTVRDIRNAENNPLPALYTTGFVSFQQGIEGDIVDGLGAAFGGGGVLANDVTIISQMVLNNIPGPLLNPNQFQRADVNLPCGNGRIDSGDVTVIAQYSLGNLAPVAACGPTTPVVIDATEEAPRTFGPQTVGRIIRAVSTTAAPGGTVTMSFVLDSQGNEASISYSVVFPQAVLSNPVVALGSGVPSGSSVLSNTSQVAQGRLGLLVATPNAYAAGTRQMLTITFNVAAGATPGTYPVTFSSNPVGQSVSAAAGGAILTDVTYEPGNIVIGTTAAGVRISGRVTTPNGQGLRNATVVMTDSEGNIRTAITSSFGIYTFEDVESGGSYAIGVKSNRYRFASRIVNVSDNLADVDFVGQE